MTNIFDDIKGEIELFFNDLNWTFILIFIFILYGIKNKEEFQWFNDLLKRKFHPYKAWIAGLITLLFFIFFKFLEGGLTVEYASQILRSFILVLVFNSVFSKNIEKIDK